MSGKSPYTLSRHCRTAADLTARTAGDLFARYLVARYIEGTGYTIKNCEPDEARLGSISSRATGFHWYEYQYMLRDRARTSAYMADIATLCPGRTVLEIGTGPTAPLTRACLKAGALHVTTIEGSPATAALAARALARPIAAGRCELHSCLSTDLTPECLGRAHFDVLVLEVYGTIACRESVIETVNGLYRAGFTFGAVTSKGFDTYIQLAHQPATPRVGPLMAKLADWPDRNLAAWTKANRCTIVGTPPRAIAVSTPTVVSTVDLGAPAANVWHKRVSLVRAEPGPVGGLLVANRFHFHTAMTIDTGETPTHWGRYFVPLPDRFADVDEIWVEVEAPDPETPSEFVLLAGGKDVDTHRIEFLRTRDISG